VVREVNVKSTVPVLERDCAPQCDKSIEPLDTSEEPVGLDYSHRFSSSLWIRLRPIIAEHRRNWFIKTISKCCRAWLKAYENCNGDFSRNGEELLLQSLSAANLQTIFDVGANEGRWSLLANRLHPGARIYAFELSSPTYQRLEQRTASIPNIRAYNCGLSDVEAEVAYHHYPSKPWTTSLLKHSFAGDSEQLIGQVNTGDDVCEREKITHIDLLKIDVEGMESGVLKGFAKMMAQKNVSIIQFEYEKLNTETRFLLEDFYQLLEGYGFAIGKMYPRYVDFRKYDYFHELDWGSNYLAVHRSREDLFQLIPQ